jgi:hypothetical protein
MAAIKQDGVYEASDGSRFQFRKGHELTDEQLDDLKRVGDFPEPEADLVAERNAKAAAEAENKAAAAPENKKA